MWFPILLPALMAAVVGLVLELMSMSSDRTSPIGVPLGTFISSVVANWVIVFFFNPAFAHPLDQGWPLLVTVDSLILVCATGISNMDAGYNEVKASFVGAIVLFVLIIIAQPIVTRVIMPPSILCDNESYQRIAHFLKVTKETAPYPDTDLSRIIQVSEETALVMASRGMGGPHNYGSWLQPNRAYLQLVKGHPYYIVDLKVTNWGEYDKNGQVIPGYLAIDALDPNKQAEQHFNYKMKYVPANGAWNRIFAESLDRYTYFNWLVPHGEYVEDLDGLEVTDDWQPIYTGSIMRYAEGVVVKVVDHLITVDPQSGQITEYKISDKPAWIDRVWPESTIKDLVDWWGRYTSHRDCVNEAGQMKIDDLHDVITHEGLAYQVTMTSQNADQSVTNILYISPTTGEAKLYNMQGATSVAVKHLIEEASKGENAEGFEATNLQIHMVFGQPVWYAILMGKSVDNKESAGSYARVAFVQASHTSENSNVIIAKTLNEAYNQLRIQIASDTGQQTSIAAQKQTVQYTGVLDRKGTLVVESTQYVLFTLKDTNAPTGTIFRVTSNRPVAALMREGDKLTVTAYKNTLDNYTDITDILDENLPSLPKQ